MLPQIRQMRTLVPFSVMANVCIVVGFAITLYYMLDRTPSMDNINVGPTIVDLPIFFSTAIYSMEGIGTVRGGGPVILAFPLLLQCKSL